MFKYIFTFTFLIITILLLTGCGFSKNENNFYNIIPSITVVNSNESVVSPTPKPIKTTEESNESRAQVILREMTIEDKVGQLFFVRLRKQQAIEDIKKYC